jgi:hypothetical protein
MQTEEPVDRPATYPLPDSTIAGDPGVLAAIAAAVVGVMVFWRKKKPGSRGTD